MVAGIPMQLTKISSVPLNDFAHKGRWGQGLPAHMVFASTCTCIVIKHIIFTVINISIFVIVYYAGHYQDNVRRAFLNILHIHCIYSHVWSTCVINSLCSVDCEVRICQFLHISSRELYTYSAYLYLRYICVDAYLEVV